MGLLRDRREAGGNLLRGLGLGAACLPLVRGGRARAQVTGTPKHRRLMVIEMTQGLRQTAWKPAEGRLAAQARRSPR